VPGRLDDIAAAARQAATDWRRLLDVSRPRAWLVTGVPFFVGAVTADGPVGVTAALGMLYFLGPFGLLVHGMADVAADDRAGRAGRANATRFAIAATNLPLLVPLVLLSGPAGAVALLATVGTGIAWSTAPARTRERPGLDVATGGLFLGLPALCGLLVGGAPVEAVPWLVLAAAWAWGAATYAMVSLRGTGLIGTEAAAATVRAIGPRRAAGLALAGYAIAAVLVAALGPTGLLAALGLALYLMLPAMVLAPASVEAASSAPSRAWAGLRDLTVLVGAWLALLLLGHRGVIALDAREAVLALAVALTSIAFLDVVLTRIATSRRRVPAWLSDPASDVPSLTVVVPCRNAIEHLPATLAALRAQTYPDATIRVVDDGSDDGSPDEAAAWLGADAVVSAPRRPPGWTSRNWASHVGATGATTDLVLFVDEATVLAPIATRLLIEQLEAGGHDLLSGVTRYAMPTSRERAGVPGSALLLFSFVPIWWSAFTAGRPASLAFAHGSLLLVRREAYAACGGHAGEPSASNGAVALARACARAGRRVGTIHAARLGATRRHRGAEDVIARWRRSFLPAVGGSLGLAIAAIAAATMAFIAPLALPLIALLGGGGPVDVAAMSLPLAVLLAARVALALTQHQPLASIAWHPVTVAVMLAGQVVAIVDHVRGERRGRRRVAVGPAA
jgi:4-hydroxybenzoate polyprenyltransferase